MNEKQIRRATVVMFVSAAFMLVLAAILPGNPVRIAPKTKSPVPGLPCPPNCAPMLFASPATKPHIPIPVPSPATVAVIRHQMR